MKKKVLIGVVGLNGSGKSSLCKQLKDKGFYVISLSDVVRRHNVLNHISLERDHLTLEANKLKKKHGLDYFAKKTYEDTAGKEFDKIVFDSVRHPLEIQYLKEKGTIFIGVDAPVGLRYERIKLRQKATDFVDFETFKMQDRREQSGDSYGQNIEECFNLCDTVILNESSYDNFCKEVNKLSILK